MTITMGQLIAFRNNIAVFGDMNLPLKAAYKINKIKKAAEKEGEFYAEKFQEILNKYAQKDEKGEFVFSEDGNQIIIQEDKIEECNDELENLQNLEVEIDNMNLTIDDLGDEITCTPDELDSLMPFMA